MLAELAFLKCRIIRDHITPKAIRSWGYITFLGKELRSIVIPLMRLETINNYSVYQSPPGIDVIVDWLYLHPIG